MRLVVDQACQLLEGDAVGLYLWDAPQTRLMFVFSNDRRQPADERPVQVGEGAVGQAVKQRQAVIVDDYASWEHRFDWAVDGELKSVEAVPLQIGDDLVGALDVRFYDRPRSADPDRQHRLSLVAAQVAPTLAAARLYAASTLEREHERALREITQALAANLDERRVLALAVRFSAQLLEAPYARVWLREPNGELSCAAAEGFVQADTFDIRLSHNSTSGLVAHQQIVNLANAPAEPGWKFNREFGAQTGLGAYLGAGLWRAGESFGVLEVMRRVGYRFTELEERLLLSLANAVAVAVSNARTHFAVERLAREAELRAEAVAESERMLRTVYEALGSGVLVYDVDGQIINANAAAEEILDRRVDELLRMGSGDFLPSVYEDGSPMPFSEGPYRRVVAERQPIRKYVFGINRPDGARRWLQVDSVPIFAPDGSLTRVISSFFDVTDRKQSLEALRQRDIILEAVAFAAEQLLTAADWDHSMAHVLRRLGTAAAVSRVYIVPAAEHEASDVRPYEWVADGVADRDLSATMTSLDTLGLARWEPILRAGGTIEGTVHSFPIEEQQVLRAQQVCSLVAVPIFAADQWWGFIEFDDCAAERDWPVGTVEGLKTAAGTIGASILRRRAEAERLQLVREQVARAEAEAARQRLAFLAEASQLLAASLDYETTLQAVANLVVRGLADCCLIDVREGEGDIRRVATALSEPFRGLLPDLLEGEIDPDGDHPIAVAIRSGEATLEPRLQDLIAAASSAAFDSAVIVPLATRSGAQGAITWLGSRTRPSYGPRDLGLAQDLARRCGLAIENARLYREARAAVGLRDEFMSVAAHELKTPMTSLRGYAQLLEREYQKGAVANPERIQRAASTIQLQADKLARLVSQLLDVTRIQSGKLAIERRPADLSVLAGELIATVGSQLKNHVLDAVLPPRMVVMLDPLRIEQVLTNLLDNAIKYSPDGGQIDITLSRQGDQARLAVRDHGVGVPLEHRGHIFDRFYQAHAGGPLTSMAGMGLGLYISRQIVELHGGTIHAEFPDDGGTRLVVLLPARG
jgi:PAS domain S-box-containing protein